MSHPWQQEKHHPISSQLELLVAYEKKETGWFSYQNCVFQTKTKSVNSPQFTRIGFHIYPKWFDINQNWFKLYQNWYLKVFLQPLLVTNFWSKKAPELSISSDRKSQRFRRRRTKGWGLGACAIKTLTLSIYLSIYLVYLSICLSVYLVLVLSIYISFFICFFLSFFISLFLSFSLIYLLSIYLYVYLSYLIVSDLILSYLIYLILS